MKAPPRPGGVFTKVRPMTDTKQKGPRVRARDRTHRCYELAGKGQQRDPSWTLVHGTIRGWIGHAWLEKDGAVYDAVLDRFMSVEQYVEEFGAKVERRYSRKEAAHEILSAQRLTWGPWHATKGAGLG